MKRQQLEIILKLFLSYIRLNLLSFCLIESYCSIIRKKIVRIDGADIERKRTSVLVVSGVYCKLRSME